MDSGGLVTKALFAGGKLALDEVRKYLDKNTSNLRDAVAADARAVHAQHAFQLVEHLKRYEVDAANQATFNEALVNMLSDSQFQRMQRNLEWEAIRETLDDRREMLAVAAGGLCDPELTINEKARIERTLRLVDVADVFVLRSLAAVGSTPLIPSTSAIQLAVPVSPRLSPDDERKRIWERHPVSMNALATAGCVVARDVYDSGIYDVTVLGEQLLRVLTSYEPTEAA